MVFNVKELYRQESKREGKTVRSIHRGKIGGNKRVQRPTKIDLYAGDQLAHINEKIKTLYEQGAGDRRIAKILMEEDRFEEREFEPFGHNVIKTQRHRMGVPDRVRPKPEPKQDWEAIAAKQKSSIDELNTMLASTMDERDRYISRLEECNQKYYSLKYPSV